MPDYLTEKRFNEWKDNDYKHLVQMSHKFGKRLARVEGILWIAVPLLIAILTILGVLVSA